MTSKAKINKYLEINDSEVSTKMACIVELDLSEYRSISEDYGEDIGIEETESVFKIPGFFKIQFPEINDSIDFFFPYSIYLNKTEACEVNSKKIMVMYEPGESIFYAKYKEAETDIKVLNSLFENGAKYLASKPDKLVTSIWQQMLPSSIVPFHHIELMVSQLYGKYNDRTGQYEPLRVTGEMYSKEHIMNTKQAVHSMYNSLGFLYGHSNDALRMAISKRKGKDNSFFEDVIGGNYDKLIEDQKKYQ